jgi:phospholipid/cholesterol/gamma-HCH transport system substrate-binding protein
VKSAAAGPSLIGNGMETKANYVLIGAFTLAVIAGAFMFVLWFSGASKTAEHKSYRIVFTGSVSGLTRGSSVLFNGLNVGAVTAIDFLPDDPSKVAAFIDVAGRTPVKTDTKARLESQGLTGVAAIALTGGAEDAPTLGPGPNGEMPTIAADRSDFQNLLENVQRLSAKADGVLEKADKLLGDNGPAVADTLKNVDSFSKALADNSSGVKAALSGVADLGEKIGPLAKRLEGLSDDVDKLVRAVDVDKIRDVVKNVDTVSANLGAFSSTLANNQGHIDSLLADSAALAKTLNGAAGQLDGALGDFRNLAKSVDPAKISSVVDRLQTLVASVEPDKVRDIVGNVDNLSQTLSRNQGNIDSLLSSSATVAKNLTGSSEKLDAALGDFGNLVKSVDGKKVAGAVDNLQQFSQTLGDNRGNVDRTFKNVSELSAKLNNSADRLDGLMASVQGFVGSPDAKGALAEVADAARSVRQFADDLNLRTRELSVGLTRFTGSGLREYEALAVDARRTLGDLDHAIRSFERSPNQLIFGAKPALPEYHGGQ